MRSKELSGMVCSIAGVMNALGDQWGLIVMRDVLLGLRRFDEFQRSSGVTNATLTNRLRLLERNGLVARRLYQTRPERHEYHPTGKGRDLRLLIQAMLQIGDKWNVTERDGPPLLLIDPRSGRRTRLVPVDDETGARLEIDSLVPAAGPGADDTTRWRLEQRHKS